jgi:FkbM family methyltransferase
MLITRLAYYASSIRTLVAGLSGWAGLCAALLRLPAAASPVIGIRPQGLRFRVRGAMDVWVIKETCLDCQYERLAVDIEDGWTVIDIGAGLGDFAIHAAAGRPLSTVYAYEPSPGSVALLKENVRLNGLSNVHVLALAVSGTVGTAPLYTDGRDPVMFRTVGAAASDGAHAMDVPTTTLDAIVAELRLERCDFLKIDCEGAEYEILLNTAKDTLRKVRHICLEYHDGVTQHSHAELVSLFEANGFAVRLQSNPVHRHLGLLYARNLSSLA